MQRRLTIGADVIMDRARLGGLAEQLTPDQFTRPYRNVVTWHLNRQFDANRVYPSFMALLNDSANLLERWEAGLRAVGVPQEDMSIAYTMYNLLAENADPRRDEVVIHKLIYHELKKLWQETRGGGVEATHHRGTVYNPRRGDDLTHTMPLNFSWLVAVAHRGLPVRIVVPITRRILIRDQPPVGDLLPLSATAREILGLLRPGLYVVDRGASNENEIVLRPNPEAVWAMPTDVLIEASMRWEDLVRELEGYGIAVQRPALAEVREILARALNQAFDQIDRREPLAVAFTPPRLPAALAARLGGRGGSRAAARGRSGAAAAPASAAAATPVASFSPLPPPASDGPPA